MTTIALQQNTLSLKNASTHYNKSAIIGLGFALLFISYFFLPQTGVLYPILNLSVLFVVILPFAAFILSVISLRQISYSHGRGATLSYVTLGITSLYFMVALAVPIVLFGAYLLYTFVF